jgi:hypothetical protein
MPSFDGDLQDWPEGGFGLPLVFATMDAVEYQHTDGVNEIRLFVRRQPPSPSTQSSRVSGP